MRTWIYNRVNDMPGLPSHFDTAPVISSGAADNPTAPFLLVSMAVEQPPLGSTAEMRVQSIPFTVWVHDKPGSMVAIDAATVAVKNDLPTEDGFMIGGLSVYRVKWEETGQDSYDDHFGTNCRPVRFSAMTRR